MDKYLLSKLLDSYKFEDSSRIDGNIHISDMTNGFCHRKFVYCLKNNIPFHIRQYLSVPQSFTYEIGRAVQAIAVNRYKKMSILIGTWKCLSCDYTFFGTQEPCKECGSKLIKYVDTKLILDGYGIPIVGNIDMLILTLESEILPTEIKSIKPDSFDKLTEPELLHQNQISLYLWLLKSGAKIACKNYNIDLTKYKFYTKYGLVNYFCKTYKQMPFKVFRTKYNQELVTDIEAKLIKMKNALKSGKVPKRICANKFSLLAKNCHIKDKCFEE